MTNRPASAVNRRVFLTSSGNIFIASCVVSGCGSLLPAPKSPSIYVLEPPISTTPAVPRVNWQLVVALPRAQMGLDTIRIALRKSPPMQDYYADAAWPDRLPVLIQDLLIEAFVRSGRIVGVARDDSGLAANYRLETELLNFEAHYDQPENTPAAVVQFGMSLVSLPTRTIIARKTMMERVAATKNDLAEIVKSFDEATALNLEQIVAWTFGELPA